MFSARNPPITGPIILPIDTIAMYLPSTFPRFFKGRSSVSIALEDTAPTASEEDIAKTITNKCQMLLAKVYEMYMIDENDTE